MGASTRVAFVLPSFAGGGAERVLINLCRAIDRHRFAPELVVLQGAGPLRDAVPADTPVHDLGTPRLRRALPALVATLRRMQPGTVVSTFGHVNLALLALRRFVPGRIVLREANLPTLSLPHAPFASLTTLAYRRLYPHADAIICTSRRMAAEFADGFAVARERLHVLENPVDESAMRAAIARPARAPGPGLRFVAAGRLTRQKGFDRLIDMFADLPSDARLEILGEGPDGPALRDRAERAGLEDRVSFPGFDPAPWARYAGADALLLPSRWEGMSNAALESLACGTPVIATPEAGGIGEVAEAAHCGAVTVAACGAPFVAAMRAVRPAATAATRGSLLPPTHRLDSVCARFETLLVA